MLLFTICITARQKENRLKQTAEKIFSEILKKVLTYGAPYDIMTLSQGKPSDKCQEGGWRFSRKENTMSTLEILTLLSLIASVVFGVLNSTKKK